MTPLERITVEPGKRGGRPCVRGLRITVTDVLDRSPSPSVTLQPNDCVWPSFSLPVEPESTITGATGSLVTVTVRVVGPLLEASPVQSPSASVALTVISNTPVPNELKSNVPLAFVDELICVPSLVITTEVLPTPEASVTLQPNDWF